VKSPKKPLAIPVDWSFKTPAVASAFDSHVREQLPWYEIATGAVAHVARCYIPQGGTVIDVGASTGNIGRAIQKTLEARSAKLIALDASEDMRDLYDAPGSFEIVDVTEYDFGPRKPDLIICFLALMFVPVKQRAQLIARMKNAVMPGGAIAVVDKIVPSGGYLGTVSYRLTLAAKYEAGAAPDEIIAKELSIAGVQRPMSSEELSGFTEFFRFGDFAGFVWESH
jgi:tRNA (cmo5U34)-methyltransferase